MALEKVTAVDQLEIILGEDKRVQVRQTTRILDDGVEISKSYHRWVISPGEDYSGQETIVQQLCNVVFAE